MNIKIDEKVERPLLACTEVRGIVAFEQATPSRADLKKELSKSLSVNENLVIIRSIDNTFGDRVAAIVAQVFKSEDDVKRVVPEHVKKRNAPKEPKKEEKEAPAKKEEAPEKKETAPEEKKEEAPKEEKKEEKAE